MNTNRSSFFQILRKKGIGVNVHYIPVYLHPYYREHLNLKHGLCPIAEQVFEQIISLPIHPNMSDEGVEYIIENVINLTRD